jgi:DNA-binding winged helix-turn-helix (wHTH) protein/tetratricopeptide (TPR) repeat protein
MIHAFRGCELDEELFQLRRRGRVVKLEPRAFDLLLYLLRNRDRVVEKNELLDAVWHGASVSESVLPSSVAAARRAVGDDRRGAVIATVHGRGYRFVAPVEEIGAANAAPEPAAAATVPVLGSPFVGRSAAMQSLRAGLEAALAGSGRLLLLVGEPGIGKTRTTDEFAAEARQRGAAVHTARCHEGTGAPAFWPWIRLLRACVEGADPSAVAADMGAGAAEIVDLAPELRERLGEVPRAPALEDEQARFRLFDSVTQFLRRAAARSPLVLVIDDLHWADEASLHLLRFLAGEVASSQLLLIAAYRDVEVHRGNPLAAVLGSLAREPACERIALRGLERPDVSRLVESILGRTPPEPLVANVCDMTEGNPFFVQEMVRLLAEGPESVLDEAGTAPLALPQSVRDAVGRRLDALSSDCNRTLRVASVVGREFSVALLVRVTGIESDKLLELLGEALAAQVIVETGEAPGLYAFGHALIRQTLFDELDNAERVRLHRLTTEAMEALWGAHPEPHLPELAHHSFQASAGGDPEKAVHYCTLAAQRAHRLLAYEEAARSYERALHALELCVPRDETQRCELLLACGAARTTAGAIDAASEAFTSAAEIARRLSRPDLLARAALGVRGDEMGAPVDDATLALMDEALEAIGDEHPALRARILGRRIGTPPYSKSMEMRDTWSREGRAIAHELGDREALRDVLVASRWACLGPDRIDTRFALAREMFDVAEASSDASLAAVGHEVLMGAHILRGDLQAGDRELAAYARIARELRQPVFLWQALVWQGSRAASLGKFAEAERLIAEARERGRGRISMSDFVFAGQMYQLRSARGDADDVEGSPIFFGEMMEAPYSWAPAIRSALAQVHADRGDVEVARREFDDLAREDFRELPRDEHWLPILGSYGGLATALDDEPRGARVYELLEPYADLLMVHDILRVPIGTVSMVLANLATMLGRYEAAESHYERALAIEGAMDSPLSLLATRANQARMFLLRDGPGDRAVAAGVIDAVVKGWASFGIRRPAGFVRHYPELHAALKSANPEKAV